MQATFSMSKSRARNFFSFKEIFFFLKLRNRHDKIFHYSRASSACLAYQMDRQTFTHGQTDTSVGFTLLMRFGGRIFGLLLNFYFRLANICAKISLRRWWIIPAMTSACFMMSETHINPFLRISHSFIVDASHRETSSSLTRNAAGFRFRRRQNDSSKDFWHFCSPETEYN